jgi:hypothetical protein
MYTDKKTLSVADAVMKIMEAEKMAAKDHDQDGKIESGKDEYLGSRIRAAKMAGKMKKEEKIDEAFPTVADGEKSLRAKEGKTSMGTVTKTKTGLVHSRDYEDDSDDTPAKKGRPTGGGAGKSTKKKKLSEMIAAYKEKGIDSLYEEPDNATFTKELKDQEAKMNGKKKGGDVAKPSVQAVKMEEADYEEDDGPLSEEQLDELSKSTVKSYVMKKMEKPTTTKKDVKGMTNAYNRLKGYKPTSEEVEQLEERTLTSGETKKKEEYVKGMKKSVSGFKDRYGDRAKEVMYATATKMAKKD